MPFLFVYDKLRMEQEGIEPSTYRLSDGRSSDVLQFLYVRTIISQSSRIAIGEISYLLQYTPIEDRPKPVYLIATMIELHPMTTKIR